LSFGTFYGHSVHVFCGHSVHVFCGHLAYFVVIWYILWSFGTFCGHLVYIVVIWYILWSFGIFCGLLVHFVVFWYILWSFGIFCGYLAYFVAIYLVYFMVIWHMLWSFGIFFPFWFVLPSKIWQPWLSAPPHSREPIVPAEDVVNKTKKRFIFRPPKIRLGTMAPPKFFVFAEATRKNGISANSWDSLLGHVFRRVARWFIFNPKIPIWVNFGGP
jgi:hypothetical protein